MPGHIGTTVGIRPGEDQYAEWGYYKQVRMAECLTDKVVPVNCFQSIAVRTQDVKVIVEQKLQGLIGSTPYVDIQPWLNI